MVICFMCASSNLSVLITNSLVFFFLNSTTVNVKYGWHECVALTNALQFTVAEINVEFILVTSSDNYFTTLIFQEFDSIRAIGFFPFGLVFQSISYILYLCPNLSEVFFFMVRFGTQVWRKSVHKQFCSENGPPGANWGSLPVWFT